MAIRALANVQPGAVRAMYQKIDHLRNQLLEVNRKIEANVKALNEAGFQDIKFNELQDKMNLHRNDLHQLQAWMERFTVYLQSQERILISYLESKKLR